MRELRWATLDAAGRTRLLARQTGRIFDPAVREGVLEIIEDVRAHGDDAIVRAMARYDGCEVDPATLRVGEEEVARARAEIPDGVVRAIRQSIDHVRRYNERVLEGADWRMEIEPGLMLGEKTTPIASAGLYIPSGKGSFPSVLVQIGTPAIVAGVPEIAVVVPPVPGPGGKVDPAVLVVADELGLRHVFRANGPAGIAALSFGTETIPQVLKVLGPGSPPVQAAQIEVQRHGTVAFMILGPSESLVIADGSADVRLLAADLLNEAEHGMDSASLLVTADEELLARVQRELTRQIAELPEPRQSYARSALGEVGGAVARPRSRRGRRRREPVRPRAPAGRDGRRRGRPRAARPRRRDPARPVDALLGGQLHARRARVPADGTLRARLVRHHGAGVREDRVDRARVRGRVPRRLGERARPRGARGLPRPRSGRPRSPGGVRPHPRRVLVKRHRTRLVVALCALFALPAVAAASTGGKAAIPSKPEAGTFQMGIEPWLGYGPWRIAEKNKLFAKQGMSVKITNFDTDDEINSALAAKRLDGANIATHTALRLAAAGLPITIVLLLDQSTTADAILGGPKTPTIASLKGKSVAYEPGTTSDILLRYALEQNGMKFSDIKAVSTPAANAGVAALAGKVDAAVTYEPYLTTALNQHKGFKLIYTAAKNPGLIGDVFVVRNDVLAKKPGQILALIKAWGAAVAQYRTNKGPSQAIITKAVGAKPGDLTTAFNGVILYNLAQNESQLHGTYIRKTIVDVKKIATQAGLIKGSVDLSKLIDSSFVDAAAKG